MACRFLQAVATEPATLAQPVMSIATPAHVIGWSALRSGIEAAQKRATSAAKGKPVAPIGHAHQPGDHAAQDPILHPCTIPKEEGLSVFRRFKGFSVRSADRGSFRSRPGVPEPPPDTEE